MHEPSAHASLHESLVGVPHRLGDASHERNLLVELDPSRKRLRLRAVDKLGEGDSDASTLLHRLLPAHPRLLLLAVAHDLERLLEDVAHAKLEVDVLAPLLEDEADGAVHASRHSLDDDATPLRLHLGDVRPLGEGGVHRALGETVDRHLQFLAHVQEFVQPFDPSVKRRGGAPVDATRHLLANVPESNRLLRPLVPLVERPGEGSIREASHGVLHLFAKFGELLRRVAPPPERLPLHVHGVQHERARRELSVLTPTLHHSLPTLPRGALRGLEK